MTEEVKTLLVRVSATTELLRSNLIAAEREIAKFDATTSAVTDRVDQNFRKVGQSAAIQRTGLQQLSFQLNDVATMYAMGARPMQIFASQSGQILQAVQLATGGTSRLAAFLGGPWGIALTSAAIVLTPFITKLFDAKNAAEQMGDAAAEAIAKLNASLVSGQSLTSQAADAATKRLVTNMGVLAKANRDLQMAASPDDAKSAEEAQDRAAFQRSIMLRRDAALSEIKAAQEQLGQIRSITQIQSMQAAAQTRLNASRARGPASRAAAAGRATGGGRIRAVNDSSANPITPEIAFRAEMLRYTEAQAQAMARVRDRDYEQQIELINRKADYEFEARREVLERLRQQEARQIDFLASMFEDAFRGGTNAIWRNFKNIGLAVIAQVMAQFAIARFTGKGGFNLGDAFSIGLTKVLGFADGGRPPVGRVSVVGERGPELFVPDAAGTIIPNHALGGGGVSLTINAPGATAETVSMIRREIANAAPALVAAASGNTVRALNRKSL